MDLSPRKFSVFDAEVLKRELERTGVKALHVFTIWTYVTCLIRFFCRATAILHFPILA